MKTMKTNFKSTAVLAGALVTGTATSFAMTNSTRDLLSYSNLGSGAEVRTELIKLNDVTNGLESATNALKLIEQNCGEGKCGEGKCGESKEKTEKSDKKTEKAEKAEKTKTDEGKASDDKSDAEKKSDNE